MIAVPPPAGRARRTSFNIAVTFGRQILAGVMQIGLVLMVGRVLGADGMGAYAVALLLPTLLSQLLNLGLVSANVYFVASRQIDAETAWAVSRDLACLLGSVGTGLGVLFVLTVGEDVFPSAPPETLLLAMLIFPVSLLNGLVASLFQAWEDFRSFNMLVLVQPVVAVFIGLVLLSLSSFSLQSVLAGTALAHLTGLLLGLLRLRGHVPLMASGQARCAYLRKALRYGIKAHLSNIVSFLNYRLDLFLVNLLAGATAAGIYAAAVRMVELLWIASTAVSTVLVPRLSAMSSDEVGRTSLTTTIGRAIFWVTLLGAGMLAALAEPLIVLLLGKEFVDAAAVVAILLPGIVLFSVARVLANDLAARGMVGLNLALAVVVLAVNGVMNLLLIPVYGAAGAAFATSFAYITNLGVRLLLQRRISGIVWWKLFVPQLEDVHNMQRLIRRR